MEIAPRKDILFWDRIARKYASDAIADEAGYERTIQAVIERLDPEFDVLEFGCGTGTTALRLSPYARKIIATDISAQMLAIAEEKRVIDGCDNVVFELIEPVESPTARQQYDVVLAFNALHLVPSLQSTLSSLHQSLKPGGLLISKTPCLKMMNPLIRAAVPVMQLIGKAPSVQFLSLDSLESAHRAAGFDIVELGWHGTGRKDFRPFLVAMKNETVLRSESQ